VAALTSACGSAGDVNDGGTATPTGSAQGLSNGSTPSAAATTTTTSATPATESSVTPPASIPTANKSFADRVLEATNVARATARKCGSTDFPAAPPLKWESRLESAALSHARYLQSQNLFSHTGENGSTIGDRATAAGYTWQTVGENLAAGQIDIPTVIQGWIDSPLHCENLMNARFVDLGVALVQGTSSNTYRTYWAMALGRPR
jgi:uncharacterized protein YkwD